MVNYDKMKDCVAKMVNMLECDGDCEMCMDMYLCGCLLKLNDEILARKIIASNECEACKVEW